MGIKTMFCHELLMGTFFYDGALIKDNDFGSVLDRRQPVSNNKARAPHHQAVQGLLDDAFTFRVSFLEPGSCLGGTAFMHCSGNTA